MTDRPAGSRPSCIVTGASSGIGAAAAVEIARRGYDLGLTGRNRDRLEQVAADCRGQGVAVHTYAAYFGRLTEVRDLAAALRRDWSRIDVLVNNAGMVTQRREVTDDGFERMFAVNHLAPYLLTRLLLPRLEESVPSRVVVVASDAHKFDRLDVGDYQSERSWQPLKVYGRSKLCNVLFAQELSRRVDGVSVSAVHPGFVSTSLARANRVADVGLKLIRPLIRSPEKGARTTVQLATEPIGADAGGRYFADGKPARLASWADDRALAERLWADSARMVGLEP
ncbi:MAG TPA: SDR family NAD(P)-dependent oxidoreductase [Mycobacteriales bacterium]|nr:SDR family NAD(P)-dependent oxidoreductase [Mycobacteriales bacterium]